MRCPCGSPLPYAACCAPLHRGQATASTAEQLMRSRYTAYVVRDVDYILETMEPRPHRRDVEATARSVRWQGLEVLRTELGGERDSRGVVEFEARMEQGGRAGVHRERSAFERRDGRWIYVGLAP